GGTGVGALWLRAECGRSAPPARGSFPTRRSADLKVPSGDWVGVARKKTARCCGARRVRSPSPPPRQAPQPPVHRRLAGSRQETAAPPTPLGPGTEAPGNSNGPALRASGARLRGRRGCAPLSRFGHRQGELTVRRAGVAGMVLHSHGVFHGLLIFQEARIPSAPDTAGPDVSAGVPRQ